MSMSDLDLEEHEPRGENYLACTKDNPQTEDIVEGKRVHHPDAKIIEFERLADRYGCPHCKQTWWVKIDG